jgi:peptide/nickel transport system substrate-binding protein
MNGSLDEMTFDRRRLLVGAGLAAAGGVLGSAAVAAANVSSSLAPTPGGTLTVGIGQVIEDVNVMTATGYRWAQLVSYALYDTLVKIGNDGSIIPLLAESVTQTDPKTTVVKIRQGVKFSDGRPMTVDDVVFTLNRIHDEKRPVSHNFLVLEPGAWGAAVKVDETTLKITTKKPVLLPPNMRFWWILPHDADTLDLGTKPVGTGPFTLSSFVKGDRIELTKRTDYWQSGKPYLDKLVFKLLADESVQVANFLSGDVDYLHDLSVATLPLVQGKNNSKLIPSGIFFEWWEPQMLQGPLADPKVRLALQYAMDRNKLNKIAWGGKGIDNWNHFVKTAYYNGKKYPVSYDPKKAKQMLQDANALGAKVTLWTLQGPGPAAREAQVLQQSLQASGFKADIQTRPFGEWFDKLYTKRNHPGIAVNYGTLPHIASLIPAYQMAATLPPFPPKYKKSPAPDLYKAYLASSVTTDKAAYKKQLFTIQDLELKEATVYPTMLAYNQNVAKSNVQGVESTQYGDQRFTSAYLG